MKAMNVMLCLVIAALAGFLAFAFQSGRLVMNPALETVVGEGEPRKPIISAQVQLIDELMLALESAQADVDARSRQLNKREAEVEEQLMAYNQLRKEVDSLMSLLEERMVKVKDSDMKTSKQMASVYSKMDPASAAQAFRNMESERVAMVLSQMDGRSMAAILDAAVRTTADGSQYVAEWSDAMRRLADDKDGV
ncbi:MAG: hypothetical protein JXR25_04750 [Pontiellaceae bacterium]|nr:hypothetical protein [Pontiellaceae bacterium]MBN2784115.1 hypothetical protein [Pontiellaceae bacterium]